MNLPVLLLIVVFLVACKSDESTEPTISEDIVEPEKDVAEKPSIPREILGVPLPPESFGLEVVGSRHRVRVKMKMEEVKEFYVGRLVDYELVEAKRRAEFRGLRAFMPSVRLRQHRYNEPVIIDIIEPMRPAPPLSEEAIVEARQRVKGAPVEERLPNGELVAPGARWGESYTPPKGSPLDHPRYRVNYGKPFGEWGGH